MGLRLTSAVVGIGLLVVGGCASDTEGCCPLTAGSGCAPGDGYVGGWTTNTSVCFRLGARTHRPYTQVTDAHGCPVLRERDFGPPCGDAGR